MVIDALLCFYTSHINGEETSEEISSHNRNVIEYFLNAGADKSKILDAIIDIKPTEDGKIDKQSILSKLFKETLLKEGAYYYHKELIVTPGIPAPGESYTHYKEPKIVYSVGQALDYFYNKFKVNKEWISEKQDVGALNFLLNEYKKFNFIEPIDFFLNLIDYVENARSLFDLRNYEMEFAEIMQRDILNAKVSGLDKYIWR